MVEAVANYLSIKSRSVRPAQVTQNRLGQTLSHTLTWGLVPDTVRSNHGETSTIELSTSYQQAITISQPIVVLFVLFQLKHRRTHNTIPDDIRTSLS